MTSGLNDKVEHILTTLRRHISDHYASHHIAGYNKLPDYIRWTLLADTYYKHSSCVDRAYITVGSIMTRMGIDKKSLHK